MSKVHPRLKITAGAIGAAALLMVPANVASAYDYSSARTLAPSRLAMITAQQAGGGSAPMIAPAPLKITEATSKPLARTITLDEAPAQTREAPAPRIERAVLTRPARMAPIRAVSGAPDLFGSKAIRVGSTRLDSQWRRVSRSSAHPADPDPHRPRDPRLPAARGEYLGEPDHRLQRRRPHLRPARLLGQRPGESLRRGQGDCEDYAIAKMQLLRAAGVPQRDLHLVIVRDLVRRQDHAVLAVRNGSGFYILDSNTDRVLRSEDVRDYRPIMTLSSEGSWIHGYAEPQPKIELASAAGAMVGAN